jgi:hypothetical protein
MDAERLLAAFNELCADSEVGETNISARTIALRAGVDPDRAMHLLFELAAAGFMTFEPSADDDLDTSVATCPES